MTYRLYLSAIVASFVIQSGFSQIPKPWNKDKVILHQIQIDSLELILQDYTNNVELDSMWRSQLTDQTYSKHLEYVIKDSLNDQQIIREVSTEVLKERLAALNAKTPFNIEYNESLLLKERKRKYRACYGIKSFLFPHV